MEPLFLLTDCAEPYLKSMLKSRLLFFIALTTTQILSAQIEIGDTYTLNSEILEQEREIQVYLPESYEAGDASYPVLFILDGQWHFTNGVAIQRSLRVPDRLPEMIVVGIKNQNPLRRTLFLGDRDKFHAFLEKEMMPFIEQNFRASNDRILFGWETAAFFVGFELIHPSQLFSAGIMSNGAYLDEDMLARYEDGTAAETYLYFANSRKDIFTINSSEGVADLLKQKSPKKLKWKYELFNDEVHESLAYLTLYHGLNEYYDNFPSVVFPSLQEYEDLGGLDYLREYYKARGERFGLDTAVDNSAKNMLIWLAWRRDNFEAFSHFMEIFKEVLPTARYQSGYWQNRLGQFYLKYGDAEHALIYFERGIAEYPDAPQLAAMYNGLAKTFLLQNKRKLAKNNFKEAIKVAEKTSDPLLTQYQQDLSALK